ncbi:MAG: alanine dehydrogenase [Mariniphaga sp.]|nr:alanine dehydrogenase [Mariniphaga sp.]
MKIAILRETRRWKDRRVAIIPATALKILKKWPSVKIFIQPSEVRVFSDKEYEDVGVEIKEDISDCDVLIGVKEVSEEALIEGKTYIMFAHVAKKQEHNKGFFRVMAQRKITLLDYEYFTNEAGLRLVAFGHWAGVVGAYYAIMGILKRYHDFKIPHPSALYDAEELYEVVKKVRIRPLKIVITGDGRVGQGAAKVLQNSGIKKVEVADFLEKSFDFPVYCILPFQEYVQPKAESAKTYNDFFTSPEEFESTFQRLTKVADVYIPCHFWHPKSPLFFTKEDVAQKDFKISMVADISCDVPGPVATTIRTSEHETPYYDIDRETLEEKTTFSDKNNITVVAVDNLPTALPRNSSESFSTDLLKNVFPYLFENDSEGIIERATILKNGTITPRYGYLSDFLK